jgi:hypothetical protein
LQGFIACDFLTFSVATILLKSCGNRTVGAGVVNGVSDSEFLCDLASNLSIRLTGAWPEARSLVVMWLRPGATGWVI